MSTNTTTALSRFDSDVAETVNTFVDTVTEALADTQADSDLIDAVEEAGNDVADAVETTVSELQSENDDLRQELDDERDRRSAEIEGCHNRITNEVDDIADDDDRGDGSSDDNPKGQHEETTALERICALPENVVEDNLTRNQQRARSIAQLVKEIGKSVPAGVAITSSRIKRALSAREDTTIHRQTVKRVADFLKRFGDGGVKIKETRGGKTTVVFDEELATAVTGVVTEEEPNTVTPAMI